ncbi:MAG: hypothetical protein WBH77_10065 [Saccharofermentanales bacterium]
MKKFFILLISVIIVLSVGCGNKENDDKDERIAELESRLAEKSEKIAELEKKVEATITETITTASKDTAETTKEWEPKIRNQTAEETTKVTTTRTEEETTTETTIPEPAFTEAKLGEMFATDNFEITVNSVEILNIVNPPNTSGYYYRYYKAEDGKTFVYVNADVKNLKKSDAEADEVYVATLIYGDGYTYQGQHLVLDSDSDFSYTYMWSVAPLTTQYLGYLFECPAEIETSNEPIVIEFKVDNKVFQLKYR